MDFTRFRQKETILIVAVILIFALFGLWLRLLPMEQLTSGPVQKVIFMDSWYNLRLIEVITSNFPSYPWFDPMNGFPVGKDNDWGPLYPMVTAGIAILLGATTRTDIMTVASWIPPILSLSMIPILYTIGKIMVDWKTGVIAACLTSVIAGEYLYRSFFGYLDHHFMETLFSTAFILFYLLIIRESKKTSEEKSGLPKKFVLFSVLAGLVYYLGIMNIPTMFLFAGIVGIFCGLHGIFTRDEASLRLLTGAHGIIFGIFILLFTFTGIHSESMSLPQYSLIHIILALLFILEPLFLTAVIHYTHKKSALITTGMILGIPAAFFVIASLFLPAITQKITEGFTYFFFFSYKDTFINEMQMWDLTRAYHSFNIALLIMAAGLVITGYQVVKQYDAKKLLILTWAFVILLSTILHLRYEYYAAVIVVLFSSIALISLYDFLIEFQSSTSKGIVKSRNTKPGQAGISIIQKNIPLLAVSILILIITALSAQITWVVATEQLQMIGMNDDWGDALTWLEKNSPDTGIDDQKIYTKEGFSYPNTSYGILSWWDYGHWITYLGKRIPITTPFQNNVGPVAQFLISTDEKTADGLAEQNRARYIIIDYETINSKYPSLPLWAFGQNARDTYQKYYYQQSKNNPNQYDPVLTLKPDFFKSMVSRLYTFDGTETNSSGANLVMYGEKQTGGQKIPVVNQINQLTPDQADKMASEPLTPGTDLVSIQYTHPITKIPALTHYRLVYESPTVTASDEYAEMHNVKIFERVPGYQITGTGTIELPLVSNQGRKFTYRQESVNGTFTVPYSTKTDGTGVHALGPYRNIQTGETYEVAEEQILQKI
ncbi:MAG: oligosaccharyl transferase, archaeosortase A system-associated [Methanospirillum sp.]|uniref:oligosaccharyl transferase, archaeosortase A system-associated n=1 Tax=Methanospirillum sp. TaxID=45200 RepID=UPI00236CEBD4|nr:oligosaccharyl transferase, archaeosortase A system-associated [Methanospirillum sp.]MDD1730180.1 oligosaccharyl transferase, archaeosortase A system-associated [Methanospirillum sp.]